MIKEVDRIDFVNYYWTPYPFIILFIIGLIEGIIASKLLSGKSFNRRILLTILLANVIGYFGESGLSIILNGGYRMFVWIPWVKLLNNKDLLNYLLSFPIIFTFTILFEFPISWIFLRKEYHWKKILLSIVRINIISWIIIIIVVNCIIFNLIKGLPEGVDIILQCN